ncbi:hypothetical protein VE03_03942 [Pseudogymnoascus sp. 23342-1-I1]|nr:hypothetical protein VE03_03942 [Pseudogymnoascus sp. 23342-1-I1]
MNYTPPPFQPIHFVPANDEAEIRNRPLLALHLVAHEPLTNGANHWSFYLQTTPSTSITLDATPSHTIPSTVLFNGSKAHLTISALPYLYPESATKVVSLSVREGLTVGGLVDLVVGEGRARYEFNGEGRGCRMWTTDLVTLFEGLGVVTDKAQAEEARRAIATEYPSGKAFPLDVGAYY